MTFAEFYYAVRGRKPFPWQERLATEALAGKWPPIGMPTAAGKTMHGDDSTGPWPGRWGGVPDANTAMGCSGRYLTAGRRNDVRRVLLRSSRPEAVPLAGTASG